MGENTEEKRYQKFKETRQERLRLELALEGFFSEENHAQEVSDSRERQERLEEYGLYLKRRIRPAVELLSEAEDTEKIEKLEMQGAFGKKELESFIEMARQKKKTMVLACLMQIKNRKYGYEDRDFSL